MTGPTISRKPSAISEQLNEAANHLTRFEIDLAHSKTKIADLVAQEIVAIEKSRDRIVELTGDRGGDRQKVTEGIVRNTRQEFATILESLNRAAAGVNRLELTATHIQRQLDEAEVEERVRAATRAQRARSSAGRSV